MSASSSKRDAGPTMLPLYSPTPRVQYYDPDDSDDSVGPKPLPVLQGFSDDLDTMLAGQGFSESAVVNLDLHSPEDSYFDYYDYDSDSDPESEMGEDEYTARSPPSLSSEADVKPPPSSAVAALDKACALAVLSFSRTLLLRRGKHFCITCTRDESIPNHFGRNSPTISWQMAPTDLPINSV
ncbi:hypothetical protein B0H10DRAFT_2061591 [Mycena sp. CBHHK59/15]|nr:hypothetical protein B0H10DRAFT_2061591 [Mycena sp. CBHHK59/15]